MAYTVRLLSPKDAEIFRALRLRAVADEPGSFLETYEEVSDRLAESYFKGEGWIAAAFQGDQAVGITGLFRHKGVKVKHKGTVWGVYVTPDARGHGLSRRMIEMVLAEAKKSGIELVMITTSQNNEITKSIYQALGFVPCGMEPHILKLPDGSYVDDVVMMRFLT